MRRLSRSPKSAAVALAVGLVLGASLVACSDDDGYTQPPTATSESLGRTLDVIGAPGRALALTRVEFAPGAPIPLHYHEGTQLAHIESGTLTYTVRTGKVRVMTGSDTDAEVVREIKAGETAEIKAGEWIVEQPNTQHSAENLGDEPVVIYLTNLLKEDAEPSTAPL